MAETPKTIARSKGERFYFGKPCWKGHGTKRYTYCGHCVECESLKSKRRQKSNKPYFAEAMRKWRRLNPQKNLACARASYRRRKDHVSEQRKDYRARNRAKLTALQNKRHAAMLKRLPPWVDIEAIEKVYSECARLRQETGIRYEVDHDIPLQGRTVSGLHVHTNLKILTASENRSKWNRFGHDSAS